MSIDTRARRAGEALRTQHTSADVDRGFDDLVRAAERRRSAVLIAAAVFVILAIASIGIVWTQLTGDEDLQPTGPEPSTTASSASGCGLDSIHCRPGQITADLLVPVSWRVTDGFKRDLESVNDPTRGNLVMVESQQTRPDLEAGVTIIEDARAVRPTRLAEIDDRVAADAESLARWIADRPSLRASDVRRTTVDGRPAWDVSVELRREKGDLPATCGGITECFPLVTVAGARTPLLAAWPHMRARYTFVDLDSAGTALVWAWSFGGQPSIDRNQQLVDTIQFAD